MNKYASHKQPQPQDYSNYRTRSKRQYLGLAAIVLASTIGTAAAVDCIPVPTNVPLKGSYPITVGLEKETTVREFIGGSKYKPLETSEGRALFAEFVKVNCISLPLDINSLNTLKGEEFGKALATIYGATIPAGTYQIYGGIQVKK